MPKMVLKQESRLNGVKTNIFNLDEVAKALRVPEEGKLFWLIISDPALLFSKRVCLDVGSN